MNLMELVNRRMPPAAWEEGDNIPWNDPAFSERMLAEHLSQQHNLASRQLAIIDRQVQWIHREVLGSAPVRVLDLACGPGLYTSRLARLGHICTGIDFAPASIRYARETVARGEFACTYRQEDIRTADYGSGYGLVMLLFGQLNVFRRREARAILERARDALAPGGLLLLEPQRFATVQGNGSAASSWFSVGTGGGLFSERPHLCLTENFWDEKAAVATHRFFIVDAGSGEVTRHAMSNEAYTDEQYRELLEQVGFAEVRLYPSLTGVAVEEESQAANLAIVAARPRG